MLVAWGQIKGIRNKKMGFLSINSCKVSQPKNWILEQFQGSAYQPSLNRVFLWIKNRIENMHISFSDIEEDKIRFFGFNIGGTYHCFVSESKEFWSNWGFTCSMTHFLVLTHSGVLSDYERAQICGHTFFVSKSITSTRAESTRENVLKFKNNRLGIIDVT